MTLVSCTGRGMAPAWSLNVSAFATWRCGKLLMRHVVPTDTPDALASCARCQDDMAHAVEDVHAGAGAAVQGRRVRAALLRPARPHRQPRVPGGSQLTVSPGCGALEPRATASCAHAASPASPCAAGDLKLQHTAYSQYSTMQTRRSCLKQRRALAL